MRDVKIRNIAYLLGVLLLVITFTNYVVIRMVAISPKQSQVVGYTLQIREIANQLRLTLSILANQDFYNENIADDINRLESIYNTRFLVLENGGEVEQNKQKIKIPKPDANTKILLGKIRKQWLNYKQDVDLLVDKLAKGKSTDTLKLDEKWLGQKCTSFVSLHDQLTELYQQKIEQQYSRLDWSMIVLGIINLSLIAYVYYIVRNLVLVPIQKISLTSRELADGNLSNKIDFTSKNEIGYIARNINDLADILKNATEFAKEIGQGNLQAQYKGKLNMANKESIANTLQLMKQQLSEVADKDRQDRWATQGIAEVSELLRELSIEDLAEMAYQLTVFVVTYMEANQGIMFVLNDNNTANTEHFLEPSAAYAANKRKIFKQTFKIGETLIGQSFADKETILLDQVPDSYEKISSALGASTPRNVLIVPIIDDGTAIGVWEILSLKKIHPYMVSFVERIAEIVSASVAAAKNHLKEQKMLTESLEVEKRTSRRG
ncbi:MAG: HAMP domain-containing protein [Thermonemataceae bacterium]|nr:HAMP domain-containing protein [Thermonemataceae bacterium]